MYKTETLDPIIDALKNLWIEDKENNMRTENSIRNSLFAMVGQMISVLMGFVARTIFISILGDEYLGLNGLFASVLSLLSLTELGIGTAIAFALYKPIAEQDEKKICALMIFYKKAYRIIALLTAVFGLLLLPFLDAITNDVSKTVPHVPVIYLLFLTNTVSSYFFSYKRTLITANQMHYLNTANESICMFSQYILQIVILKFTHNYILYLAVQLVCVFLSNVAISRKADRLYPFLKKYKKAKLDGETLGMMKTNILSMLFHRLGSVMVTGTDNIIIAQISVAVLGLYSNYTLVITTLATILSQAFNAVTASVGNLIVLENREKQFETYHNIYFLNFWIFGFFAVALSQTVEPFIALCFGAQRVLPGGVLYLMLVNFFLNGMRLSNILVINAAGLFKQIKYKSFVEAIINLVASLYFMIGLNMGIYGVLLGTTVSIVTTNLWWEPYVIFKHTFKEALWRYFVKYGFYSAAVLVSFFISKFLCGFLPGDGWLNWIFRGAVSSIVPNIVFILLFFRTPQFQYVRGLLQSYVQKFIKKKNGGPVQ